MHRRGSHLIATDLLGVGSSRRVGPELLLRTLRGEEATEGAPVTPPGVVVLSDAATADSLAAALTASSELAARIALRGIAVCRSLASSRHVVVLTEALERAFFPPAGAEPSSIDVWRRAFGLAGLSAIAADRQLYRMVITGVCGLSAGADTLTSRDALPALLRDAARAEASLLRGLEYTGLASECARFDRAGAISAVWAFVTATDPQRRELSQLDGTVMRATVTSAGPQGVTVRIAPPFKAKPGKNLVVLDPARAGDPKLDRTLKLQTVDVSPAGDFIAELGIPQRSAASSLPSDAYAPGVALELAVAPFVPVPGKTQVTRWTSPADCAGAVPARRDVPLSVSLAGAPVEGATAAA